MASLYPKTMTYHEKQVLDEVLLIAAPYLFLILALLIKSGDTEEDECYRGMSQEAEEEFKRYAKYVEGEKIE